MGVCLFSPFFEVVVEGAIFTFNAGCLLFFLLLFFFVVQGNHVYFQCKRYCCDRNRLNVYCYC